MESGLPPPLLTNFVLPPPLSLDSEPILPPVFAAPPPPLVEDDPVLIEESQETYGLPGEVKIGITGQLLRDVLKFDNFVGDSIQAYNHYVSVILPNQIRLRVIRLIDGSIVTFEGVTADLPENPDKKGSLLLPRQARDRALTYRSSWYTTMTRYSPNMEYLETMDRVFIGDIPIMLGSKLDATPADDRGKYEAGECLSDPQGFFIIKGPEKVILIQEKLRFNRFLIFSKNSKGEVICKMNCGTIKGSTIVVLSKGSKVNDIRLHLHLLGKDKTICAFQIYRFISSYAPFGFNYISPDAIVNHILQFVQPKNRKKVWLALTGTVLSLSQIGNDYENISAVRGSTQLSDTQLREQMIEELFPQIDWDTIGGSTDLELWQNRIESKLSLLSMMIARYAEYMAGVTPLDDRDNWSNKRLEGAARSIEQLFMRAWNVMLDTIEDKTNGDISKQRVTDLEGLRKVMEKNVTRYISETFVSSFNSNNWGVKSMRHGMSYKENITDTLKRESTLAVYSQLNRINTPTKGHIKKSEIRMVQLNQLGFVDPVESPEGANCGLVKQKSVTCLISIDQDDRPIMILIVPELSYTAGPIETRSPVVVNGRFVGWGDGPKIRQIVINWRRMNADTRGISVVLDDHNFLYIYTDGSRPIRPLLIVENDIPVISKKRLWGAPFPELLRTGCIEYLDPLEQETIELAESISVLRNRRIEIAEARRRQEIARKQLISLSSITATPLTEEQLRRYQQLIILSSTQTQLSTDDRQLIVSAINQPSNIPQLLSSLGLSAETSAAILVAARAKLDLKPLTLEIATPPTKLLIVSEIVQQELDRIDLNPDQLRTLQLATLSVLPKNASQANEAYLRETTRSIVESLTSLGVEEQYAATVDAIQKDLELATNALYKLERRTPYTHCEIDPNAMYGVASSIMPLINHNQAPRNSIGCGMVKQGLGVYHSNRATRFDTTAKTLSYSTRPLFDTQIADLVGMKNTPSGENVLVAIMTYTGYNQEDSAVFNQAAIDRGQFNMTFYFSSRDVEKSNRDIRESFVRPPRDKTSTGVDIYRHLDSFGVAKVGSVVYEGDIIISKIRENIATRESSYSYTRVGKEEGGVVDRILFSKTDAGKQIVKVRVRQVRAPEQGDKYACTSYDHEVLTSNRSWIPISELTTDDFVATLDPITKQVGYEQPSAIHSYQHDGPMYNLYSQQVELCVTLNHRMYIKKRNRDNYELDTAQNVHGKRVNYKRDGLWTPPVTINEIKLLGYDNGKGYVRPERNVPIKPFLVFFGIWMAEGCVTGKSVLIAAHKQRVKDALRECCPQLGFNLATGSEVWHVGDVQTAMAMESLSVGSINKYLPEWCFELSMDDSRLLINSLMLGDGYINPSGGTYQYYTSSPRLGNDLTRLALHAGWSANRIIRYPAGHQTTKKDGSIITTTADSYTITIVREKNQPQVNHGHSKTQNGQSESIIHYSGLVYCCTVSTGIFYVRKSGKPVWSGNSRNSQKLTIGITLPEIDMPTIPSMGGIAPSIIINPLCIPSRMTISKILEFVCSRVGALKGERINATAFQNSDNMLDMIRQNLFQNGFSSNGNVRMQNGMTGRMMEAEIFVGFPYYQALRHHVRNKYQSRARGAYTALAHQPVSGRKKGGGGRFGEMERDALLSHGASGVTRERTCVSSDITTVPVCRECGKFAIDQVDHNERLIFCKICNTSEFIGMVEIPYALKLLIQTLAGTALNLRQGYVTIEEFNRLKTMRNSIARQETLQLTTPISTSSALVNRIQANMARSYQSTEPSEIDDELEEPEGLDETEE